MDSTKRNAIMARTDLSPREKKDLLMTIAMFEARDKEKEKDNA